MRNSQGLNVPARSQRPRQVGADWLADAGEEATFAHASEFVFDLRPEGVAAFFSADVEQ